MSVVAASSRSGFGASVLWFAAVYSAISVALAIVESIVPVGFWLSNMLPLFTMQALSPIAVRRAPLPTRGARARLAASYVGVAVFVQLAISAAAFLSGQRFGLLLPSFSHVSRQTAQLIFVSLSLLHLAGWFAIAWSSVETYGKRGGNNDH